MMKVKRADFERAADEHFGTGKAWAHEALALALDRLGIEIEDEPEVVFQMDAREQGGFVWKVDTCGNLYWKTASGWKLEEGDGVLVSPALAQALADLHREAKAKDEAWTKIRTLVAQAHATHPPRNCAEILDRVQRMLRDLGVEVG